MISLNSASNSLINTWSSQSKTLLLLIDTTSNILEFNEAFKTYYKRFKNIYECITLTHRSEYMKRLNNTLETEEIEVFTTNFSFEPQNVEDIPTSYIIYMQKHSENEVFILAEPVPPLEHKEAVEYFSMINEYSILSRKLQKTEFDLTQKNSDLQTALEQAEYFACYDPLTNLFNRRTLYKELDKLQEFYTRTERGFSIILIDIDHFKNVNDTYGHDIGDETLTQISKLLLSECRTYEIVGRYGGEEFLIITPSIDKKLASKIANRLLEKVKLLQIKNGKGSTLSISFSAGIAEIDEANSIDEAIKLADNRLYTAKENGRSCVCIE